MGSVSAYDHAQDKFASDVLREQNGLIVVPNDSEGFKHFVANEHDPAMEKPPGGAREEQRMLPEDTAHFSPTSTQRQRRFGRFFVVAVCFCALVVGLGVGVGVGYASHVNQARPTSDAASTVILASPVPTSTSSGVISGTTGIADLQCNSSTTNNVYSATSTNYQGPSTFTEECYTDYQIGTQTLSNGTTVQIHDVTHATAYSFQACMDNCVAFNQEEGSVLCQAVVYTANLTFAIQNYGANCWLKNSRGARHNGQGMLGWEYNLTASAYLNL